MKRYEKTNHRELWGNVTKTPEIQVPKYFCMSCKKRLNNRCSFFNRPVIKDYNRCFYHTNYSPVSAAFRIPDNLEEIMREEEKKIA